MQSEILQHLTLDHYDSPIWLMNDKFEVLSYNQSFLQVFDAENQDKMLSNPDFLQLISDEKEIKYWKNWIEKTIENTTQQFSYSLLLNKKLQIFEIKAKCIEKRKGDMLISLFAYNLTATKSFEKQLEKQNAELKKINEELDKFVYSVSHQIRSPLTSLLGLINIAKIDNQNKIRDYLDLMQVSIQNLDQTVHEINDYSKNTRLDIEKENVNFKDLCEEILADISFGGKLNSFKVSKEILDNHEFYSDIERIRVIISNILSNAIKFNDLEKAQPAIIINIATHPGHAEITISDNGEGIDKKALPKIFDMFYRGARSAQGAGLGLYVVQEIVNKLQGSIGVHSELGKGSKFTVKLPNLKAPDDTSN